MGQARVYVLESHASSLGFLWGHRGSRTAPLVRITAGDVKSALRSHRSLLLLRAQQLPPAPRTPLTPGQPDTEAHPSPPRQALHSPQPSLPTDTLTGTRGFTHVPSQAALRRAQLHAYSSQPRSCGGVYVPAKHPHLWARGPPSTSASRTPCPSGQKSPGQAVSGVSLARTHAPLSSRPRPGSPRKEENQDRSP